MRGAVCDPFWESDGWISLPAWRRDFPVIAPPALGTYQDCLGLIVLPGPRLAPRAPLRLMVRRTQLGYSTRAISKGQVSKKTAKSRRLDCDRAGRVSNRGSTGSCWERDRTPGMAGQPVACRTCAITASSYCGFLALSRARDKTSNGASEGYT